VGFCNQFEDDASNMTVDEELDFPLERLQAGDEEAFSRLVEAYAPRLYRLLTKMLRHPQEAEDALQETFVKAYRALPEFDGRSRLSTWLYRIAVNEALMHIRRKELETISVEAMYEQEDGSSGQYDLVDWCCLPEDELLSAEARQVLEEAVARLPTSLRTVFLLRDVEGLSTRETAEALGISEGAVKVRLSRAREQLRKMLSTYFGPKALSTPKGRS